MASSLVNADSLLAIDVGAVNTRAFLFDVVEGRYSFVATGVAPTTAGYPFKDIGEGIHHSLQNLQAITGRTLLGADQRLILPGQSDGSGVDGCVATISAGPPMKVVAVGLLEDVSAQSAQNLASATYAQVEDALSLNDRRKSAARLDAILRLRPDLIIVAGGIENGASQSVLNLLESIGLACYLFPEADRPEVLFVGNQSLAEEVKSSLSSFSFLHVGPNIRPAIDVEQLEPAQAILADIYKLVRAKKIPGVQELERLSGGTLLPTANAFARSIRYLSKKETLPKGILGVDVGASATTIAAAFDGELTLGVYPPLGLGEGLAGLLNHATLEDIQRWLPFEITAEALRNYLYNKVLHPGTIPASPEDLSIEQALARQVLRLGVKRAASTFPRQPGHPGPNFLPWFGQIYAAGSALTQAPSRAQSLLMLLDALQPVGITQMYLDNNSILAPLGAAAAVNPVLTVQALPWATTFLGPVVAPVGQANYGVPVLRVTVTYEDGTSTRAEIKHGALEVIPLPAGQKAEVRLQPLHRFDVRGKPGLGCAFHARGGAFGLVIDARGRPLRLPGEATRRADLYRKWLAVLEA